MRIGVPMEPWIEKVSAAEQDKTSKLLREVLNSASARSLSTEVVLFVPARKIVCEDQYRDLYRSGLQAVLAELPDRPDTGIEVVSEPPSCSKGVGATGAWGELQRELYRMVRSNLDSGFGVICGNRPGAGELCPAYRTVFAK